MSNARRFLNRAPRYTLQPTDNRYLRFANKGEGHTHTTRFIDLSATGLSFIIDQDLAPNISEEIKLEIPLDDGQSVAWFGKVVRIEEYAAHRWYLKDKDVAHENQVIVGVSFVELPVGHTAAIRVALEKKFDQLYARQRTERMKNASEFMLSQAGRIAIYAACLIFAIWFFYHFTQPDANYDERKGAPWGQRFPSLNFFGDNVEHPDTDSKSK